MRCRRSGHLTTRAKSEHEMSVRHARELMLKKHRDMLARMLILERVNGTKRVERLECTPMFFACFYMARR